MLRAWLEQVNDVVNIIIESAQTGEIGDGAAGHLAYALAAACRLHRSPRYNLSYEQL